jgi:hypothetical protein
MMNGTYNVKLAEDIYGEDTTLMSDAFASVIYSMTRSTDK